VDLDGEFAPIPPPGEEADPGTLRLSFQGLLIENGRGIERAVEARGNQPVHRLTQELWLGPSEEPFDLVIQRDDPAERVYDDRSIRGCVE
jgi:hypothetical protein